MSNKFTFINTFDNDRPITIQNTYYKFNVQQNMLTNGLKGDELLKKYYKNVIDNEITITKQTYPKKITIHNLLEFSLLSNTEQEINFLKDTVTFKDYNNNILLQLMKGIITLEQYYNQLSLPEGQLLYFSNKYTFDEINDELPYSNIRYIYDERNDYIKSNNNLHSFQYQDEKLIDNSEGITGQRIIQISEQTTNLFTNSDFQTGNETGFNHIEGWQRKELKQFPNGKYYIELEDSGYGGNSYGQVVDITENTTYTFSVDINVISGTNRDSGRCDLYFHWLDQNNNLISWDTSKSLSEEIQSDFVNIGWRRYKITQTAPQGQVKVKQFIYSSMNYKSIIQQTNFQLEQKDHQTNFTQTSRDVNGIFTIEKNKLPTEGIIQFTQRMKRKRNVYQYFVSQWQGTYQKQKSFYFQLPPNTNIQNFVIKDDDVNDYRFNVPIDINKFHTFVIRYSISENWIELYKDGEFIGKHTAFTGFQDDLYFGNNGNYSNTQLLDLTNIYIGNLKDENENIIWNNDYIKQYSEQQTVFNIEFDKNKVIDLDRKYSYLYLKHDIIDEINFKYPLGYENQYSYDYGLIQDNSNNIQVTIRDDDVPFKGQTSFQIEEQTENLFDTFLDDSFGSWESYQSDGVIGEKYIIDDSIFQKKVILKRISDTGESSGRYGIISWSHNVNSNYFTGSVYLNPITFNEHTRFVIYFDLYDQNNNFLGQKVGYVNLNDMSISGQNGLNISLEKSIGGWYRIITTFSGVNVKSIKHLFFIDNGNGEVEIAYPQLEEKPFQTSFVNGTRSVGKFIYNINLNIPFFLNFDGKFKHVSLEDDLYFYIFNLNNRWIVNETGRQGLQIIKWEGDDKLYLRHYNTDGGYTDYYLDLTMQDIDDKWINITFIQIDQLNIRIIIKGDNINVEKTFVLTEQFDEQFQTHIQFNPFTGFEGSYKISNLYIGKYRDENGNIIWTDEKIQKLQNKELIIRDNYEQNKKDIFYQINNINDITVTHTKNQNEIIPTQELYLTESVIDLIKQKVPENFKNTTQYEEEQRIYDSFDLEDRKIDIYYFDDVYTNNFTETTNVFGLFDSRTNIKMSDLSLHLYADQSQTQEYINDINDPFYGWYKVTVNRIGNNNYVGYIKGIYIDDTESGYQSWSIDMFSPSDQFNVRLTGTHGIQFMYKDSLKKYRYYYSVNDISNYQNSGEHFYFRHKSLSNTDVNEVFYWRRPQVELGETRTPFIEIGNTRQNQRVQYNKLNIYSNNIYISFKQLKQRMFEYDSNVTTENNQNRQEQLITLKDYFNNTLIYMFVREYDDTLHMFIGNKEYIIDYSQYINNWQKFDLILNNNSVKLYINNNLIINDKRKLPKSLLNSLILGKVSNYSYNNSSDYINTFNGYIQDILIQSQKTSNGKVIVTEDLIKQLNHSIF